ncbi:MAG: radical SAM protein [Planctomycetes bacterium]|jgi:MoaA/NifB/PqqE/SkfB family radical SAM enzyme|nr:radical SAM protein [Planctomycetota bacterium]
MESKAKPGGGSEIGREPGERVRRHEDLLDSTPFFDVELSRSCNLRCSFCPRDRIARPAGLMADGTLEALDRWIPPGARVMLSGLGEPLLHPRAAAFVAALKRGGRTAGVTTNATLLTAATAAALVDAGIDILELSVPTLDPDLHRRLMPGVDPAAVLRNLEALRAVRPRSLRVYLAVVRTPETRPGLKVLKAFARGQGFTLYARDLHSRGGALYEPRRRRPAFGCGIFAKATFVAWTGDVLACCNDVSGCTRIGAVGESPFDELRERKRDRIRRGEGFPPCAACDDPFRRALLEGKRGPAD